MSNQLQSPTNYQLSDAEVKAIWEQASGELALQLSKAVYNTWIISNPMTSLSVTDAGAQATITCPTAFHASHLKKNLVSTIKSVVDRVIGKDTVFEIKVGTPIRQETRSTVESTSAEIVPKHFSPEATTDRDTSSDPSPSASLSALPSSAQKPSLFSAHTIQSVTMDRALVASRTAGLRSDYTFEAFAVSTSNEMAHAAATAVSNRPGVAYNPLFLYGGVGVGKTHLMHAIGNNILKNNPETKILYCSGEEFTNEIVHAIQTKKALKFKEKFRTTQVLLLDDVQFIAGKNAVQEEFFHTFNALIAQSSQIVMTSDRPPHEINLLEDRLRSRFEAGLMIDIQQPSFELRTAILLIKSAAVNMIIPMDVAQLIASKVDSARKIEGIITSIRSAVELKKIPITIELVEEILQTEIDHQKTTLKVSPNDVLRAVANHYHVKQAAVRGQQRVAQLVRARHVAMYLFKEDLNLPYEEIGKWFSGRDHSSALHAVRKIGAQLIDNEAMQRDVSALRMSLRAISR